MINLIFKDLTEKHRLAWVMRYRYRWRLTRIALEMGTTKQAVSKLLQRAQCRAGLSNPMRVSVIRTKAPPTRIGSLSNLNEY